ncbi:MAG: RNA polymerase sigma factor [Pirellulales bacterium]
MAFTGSGIEHLLRQSHQGDKAALGDLLEMHRAWLKLLVRRSLSPRLASRLDESDLVQQACLSAYRNFGQFHGSSAAEFIAWMRRILDLNLQNLVRDQLAQCRNPGREAPLATADQVVDRDDSPSQRALQGERAVQLARALEQLPSAQAEAIRLRYLEGMPLKEIVARMDRTEQAVVGLLKRGLEGLRQIMQPP